MNYKFDTSSLHSVGFVNITKQFPLSSTANEEKTMEDIHEKTYLNVNEKEQNLKKGLEFEKINSKDKRKKTEKLIPIEKFQCELAKQEVENKKLARQIQDLTNTILKKDKELNLSKQELQIKERTIQTLQDNNKNLFLRVIKITNEKNEAFARNKELSISKVISEMTKEN